MGPARKAAITVDELNKDAGGAGWDLARLLSEVDARMLKQTQTETSAVAGRSSRRSSTEPTASSSRLGGGGGRAGRESASSSSSTSGPPPAGPGMSTRSTGKGKERMRSLPSPLPVLGEVVTGGGSSSSSVRETVTTTTEQTLVPFDDYLSLGGMNHDPAQMEGILDQKNGGVRQSLSQLKMSTSPLRRDPSPPAPNPRPFRRTTSLQQHLPPRIHLSNPPPLANRHLRTTSLDPLPPPPPSPRKPPQQRTHFNPPPPLDPPIHRVASFTKALSPLKQLINSASQPPRPSQTTSSSASFSKPTTLSSQTRSSGPVTVGIPRRPASSLSKDPRRTFRPPFLVKQQVEEVLLPPPREEEEKQAPSSDGPRVDSDNSFDSFDALLLGEGEDVDALFRMVDGV